MTTQAATQLSKPEAQQAGKEAAQVPSVAKPKQSLALFGLFLEPTHDDRNVANEKAADEKHKKLLRLLRLQAIAIAVLLAFMLLMIPVMRPIYSYIAIKPNRQTKQLPSMIAPNLTDQAILSWSATAITEILTFGFGDLDRRVLSQHYRFTDRGWESFLKGFIQKSVNEIFKSRQLVLTTIPTDSPVITWKGLDEEGDYVWIVEMPIVMTYATNDNITQRRRSIVQLTLTRVPSEQSIQGIGIKSWMMV